MDCLEAIPEKTSITGVTDDGHESLLDVHFVLDGVPLNQGEAIASAMGKPYGEIGIKINPTFQEVSFPADGVGANGLPHIAPDKLLKLTRDLIGGYRPYRSDAVYTMTTKNLISSGATGSAVAGQADCIGGVRFPDSAFAVGEVIERDSQLDNWRASHIAAHEIGHLLGAHHHYANCAQADPQDVIDDATPCTLMFNDVGFQSMRFSTLEGATVRGHMLEFADHTPSDSPPEIPRVVEFNAAGDGRITMDDPVDRCIEGVRLDVQRMRRGTWVEVEQLTTDEKGFFGTTYRLGRGSFRGMVASSEAHDGTSWRTCAESVSTVVKRR
jgi:hypothetical protein